MDIEKVFSLMDKAEKSSFNKIEIEIGDIKLHLDRRAPAIANSAIVVETEKKETAKSKELPIPSKEDFILAPISGVFYAAKAPGEPAFVKEGDTVKKGDTVCIIEAMKTMNEIVAPKAGTIESVLLSDEASVSADQPLFKYAEE
jgi:acetyl-CoA carboxylase biotin carboxyl carrier protein